MLLLDTNVVYWWSTTPDRLGRAASRSIERADELAVAGITWYELAWLVLRRRIVLDVPIQSFLDGLAQVVRTVPVTPAIAVTAAALPGRFPQDPADRLIYATAIEHGCRLVSSDERMRGHPHPRPIVIW